MSGAKCAVLLWAVVLGPAMACASEEGSLPLQSLATQEKLQSHIDVNFQGVTLNEVLTFFREQLKINVVLDRSASGFADKPITLQFKDVRAQNALAWSLQQVGLRYALVGGIVLVADRQNADASPPMTLRQNADAAQSMTLRQYDVADLLMPVIP